MESKERRPGESRIQWKVRIGTATEAEKKINEQNRAWEKVGTVKTTCKTRSR